MSQQQTNLSRRRLLGLAGGLGVVAAVTLASSFPAYAQGKVAATRYDSGPLGQFAPSQRCQRIQVTLLSADTAQVSLDPNRISWDGYSPNWISTRMAEVSLRARLREITNYPMPGGKPRPAGVHLYELLPTGGQKFSDLGLGAKVRLVTSDSPERLARLLLLDAKNQITQVLLLDRRPPVAPRPLSDKIALKTGFLSGKLGRTAFISLNGSVSSGKVSVVQDGNAFQLDTLGDPSLSTMMAPLPKTAKLVERTGIPATAAVRVFTLQGLDKPMQLVLPKAGGAARLVILDSAGKATGFLPLEATK